MPPDTDPEDEAYVSSEDSDFAPENAVAEGEPDSSDDEAETATVAPNAKRKAKAAENEAEDAGFENSGDEAVIGKGKKRRRKAKAQDVDAEEGEDDGQQGGLIKTRSMRAQEKTERKVATASGPVTIDVDALWAQMITPAPTTTTSARTDENQEASASKQANDGQSTSETATQNPEGVKATNDESSTIKIKRTYNFAGKVQTEEKVVARDSAEAKLYLASLNGVAAADDEPARRMPRRAFRSAFEPVDHAALQRGDLNLGMSVRLQAREAAAAAAKKLNTVEKSRMDWAGYVDKEGIKDELELAGKSKDSFAARQDFLARSEAVREAEARRARLAGKT